MHIVCDAMFGHICVILTICCVEVSCICVDVVCL